MPYYEYDSKKHIVIDDFLSQEEHQQIYQKLMHAAEEPIALQDLQSCVPMYYSRSVADENDTKSMGYFLNMLYLNPCPLNDHFDLICGPILRKIDFKALIRAKVNWFPRTPEVRQNGMHQDYPYPVDNLLYSVNTCDGYTTLNCGTKIESVANRALIFRGDLPHCSSSTSDKPLRCNININFLFSHNPELVVS